MRASSLGLSVPGLLLGVSLNLLGGQSFLQTVNENNVNNQYIVESVSVAGVPVDSETTGRLSQSLGERLVALVGQHCDVSLLETLAGDIRKELHLADVSEHLTRGSAPEMIRVNFDVVEKNMSFDVSLPKFLYLSDQNFTGEIDASVLMKHNRFAFALVSNGDDQVERYSGLAVRFDSAPLLPSRSARLALVFEDYHEGWNQMVQTAAAGSGFDLYHSRWNVAPQVVFTVGRPFEVALGTSFERTQPEIASAGDRSANAVTADVLYRHKMEGSRVQQKIEARYNLRIATRALASTYAYARHMISAKYEAKSGRHSVSEEFTAGAIAGQAPLFDRFVLGSSSTLRGWNRFDLDPLGGSRVVHNEMTYGYRTSQGTVEVFYDAGAVWDAGQTAKLRHAAGTGFRKGIFLLAMAFPIETGHIEPVFIAGMNY
jgi:hypothetical protein